MSWGERSCKHISLGCPMMEKCTFQTCNVDCKMYEWDGKTNPDSIKKLNEIEEDISCSEDIKDIKWGKGVKIWGQKTISTNKVNNMKIKTMRRFLNRNKWQIAKAKVLDNNKGLLRIAKEYKEKLTEVENNGGS